ncbi:MAG: M48 family metalloprotease [Saprospiraceae bacterium]|nr:M48 family metalloprotease [Saprospiraceae bacterium]
MGNSFLISDALLQALGWTLVHSLWQALVLAFLLAILRPFLKRPEHRYVAAYSTLMLVLIAAVATFYQVYQPDTGYTPPLTTTTEYIQADDAGQANIIWTEPNWQDRFAGWIERYHGPLVMLWFAGFIVFFLRFFRELWLVWWLKRSLLPLPNADKWQSVLQSLILFFRLKRPVALGQSAAVPGPVTLGWWRPVILLPIALVNRLSPAEVEAVLAHELAHIARHDWLFNLMQALVEVIFYYHPAVWWMASVIHREREICCDDLAICATDKRLELAKALVHVQEYRHAWRNSQHSLTLGMAGHATASQGALMLRVRHILQQPSPISSSFMEKFAVSSLLLLFLGGIGLRTQASTELAPGFADFDSWTTDLPFFEPGFEAAASPVQDSLPKPKSKSKSKGRIISSDDNKQIDAEFEDGKISRLNIDGKDIPPAEFPKYESLIADLQREVPPPPPPPAAPGSRRVMVYPDAPFPPSAPNAPDFPFPAGAPTPPPPPPPPSIPRLHNLKSKDGERLLRFENGDKSTEILIKNGEVWVDGKKMDEGAAADLPSGYFFTFEDGEAPEAFSWGGGDHGVHFFNWSQGDGESEADAAEAMEDQRTAMRDQLEALRGQQEAMREHARIQEELAREHAQMAKEQKRMSERDRKELKREMEQAKKEMKKAEKEMEKARKELEREMEQLERDKN